MPRRPLDLAGKTFGALRVVRRAGSDAYGQARWSVRCACGRGFVALGRALRAGKARCPSCGKRRKARPGIGGHRRGARPQVFARRALQGQPQAPRERIAVEVSTAATVPARVRALKRANGFGSVDEVKSLAFLRGLAALEREHAPAAAEVPDSLLVSRSDRPSILRSDLEALVT